MRPGRRKQWMLLLTLVLMKQINVGIYCDWQKLVSGKNMAVVSKTRQLSLMSDLEVKNPDKVR